MHTSAHTPRPETHDFCHLVLENMINYDNRKRKNFDIKVNPYYLIQETLFDFRGQIIFFCNKITQVSMIQLKSSKSEAESPESYYLSPESVKSI